MPKKILITAVAVGCASAIFHGLGLFSFAPWTIVYSDVLGFWSRAIEAGLPYISKLIEYPVLTGWLIEVASILGVNRAGYFLINALVLLAAFVVATFLLFKMTRPEARRRLWLYWLLAPTTVVFLAYNWDMLAVLASVAAFYFAGRDRSRSAAVCLALGFSAKFFPIIYMAPLWLKLRSWRERLMTAGVFLLTTLLINGPFALMNLRSWSYFFTFNSARNSNPDSIWTAVRFLFGEIGVPTINFLSLALFAAAFFYILGRYWQAGFLKLCFAGTLLFLITNKIFSPQYLLWLLPFFVLIDDVGPVWFYVLELSNLAVLFIILRWFLIEPSLVYFYWALPFVLLRHGVLVASLLKIKFRTPLYSGGRV